MDRAREALVRPQGSWMSRCQSTSGIVVATLSLYGCVGPWNTRLPEIAPRSSQYERAQAKVQDPFPENDVGPGDLGFRPPDYHDQRAEPLRSKERANSAILRQQVGIPGGSTAPGINGSMYPDAVRQ